MARRMIDDRVWKSLQITTLTLRQRLLWFGLITTADDQGRGEAHPGLIRAKIFPLDDFCNNELKDDIEAIAGLGLIVLYERDDGMPLYQIVNWWNYQKPPWAWPSKLPAPDGWQDREKYRQGNAVMASNWEGGGGFVSPELADGEAASVPESAGGEAALASEPKDGEPTVGPRWGHSEPTVETAHAVDSSNSGSGSDKDPKGRAAPPPSTPLGPIPLNLEGWKEEVRKSKNRASTIVFMCSTLFPKHDKPGYDQVGGVAKAVGGWGRLAQLLWQAQTREIHGDILPYVTNMAKGLDRDGKSTLDKSMEAAMAVYLEAEEAEATSGNA